jgi:tripartite-type tricarboxylate transporter receptor subunit TctC
MKPGRLIRAATTALLLVGTTGWSAQSQVPKTIKLVVAFAPGGAVDILARILGEQINRVQGVSVIVEDRPGASGMIATDAVLHAAADGGTLLVTSDPFVITPLLRRGVYDPLVSFEPVCKLVDTPAVFVVNGASPYRTVSDLIDAARRQPGMVTVASIGPANSYHIAVENLKRTANVDLTYVPYAGSAPAINALLGGHVTSVLAAYPNAAEQMRSGQLRALAVATRERVEALPDIPTIAESGYRDFALENWFGVVAPAKTPKETLARIEAWFASALKVKEAKEKLVSIGLYPSGVCGPEFGAFLRKQYEDYAEVIRAAQIHAD